MVPSPFNTSFPTDETYNGPLDPVSFRHADSVCTRIGFLQVSNAPIRRWGFHKVSYKLESLYYLPPFSFRPFVSCFQRLNQTSREKAQARQQQNWLQALTMSQIWLLLLLSSAETSIAVPSAEALEIEMKGSRL